MAIQVNGTYRAGVIHPDQPLGLPDNTEVQVVVVPMPNAIPSDSQSIESLRPKSPRFTSEELLKRLAEYAVDVGTLPPDFSREDIYSDHD